MAGGYAGQVSLGHSAFFGIGAYSAALMATRLHASPWLGMLAGAVVATAAGLVIGYLSNRLKGPYFALATIAFSQVLLIVASRWRAFTAGSEGVPVPFARASDPRLREQGLLGLPRPLSRPRHLPRAGLPRAIAHRLSAGRGAGGRGRRPGSRYSEPPAQGAGHRRLRRPHQRVRHAVGAVRGLRGSLLCLLRGSLRPLRSQRHHRRGGHGHGTSRGLAPHHVARDLPSAPCSATSGAASSASTSSSTAASSSWWFASSLRAWSDGSASASAPRAAMLELDAVTKRFGA